MISAFAPECRLSLPESTSPLLLSFPYFRGAKADNQRSSPQKSAWRSVGRSREPTMTGFLSGAADLCASLRKVGFGSAKSPQKTNFRGAKADNQSQLLINVSFIVTFR